MRPGRMRAPLIAMLLLCGCASSPKVQFMALTAVPVQKAPASVSATLHVQITVVHIPAILDRQQMVRGNGALLTVSDAHRWAAPLSEMIRRVLTQDLIARLPPGVVVLPDEPAPAGTRQIVVDLLQFEPDASGTVVLQGSWSLMQADSKAPMVRQSARYEKHSKTPDYAGQAQAMSEVLGELATDMAEGLAKVPGLTG